MKINLHFIAHTAWIVTVLALVSCAAVPTKKAAVSRRGNHELAVLFIGNSYSFGVPKAFAKLAKQRGRKVKVEQLTHSGWSLSRHAAHPETMEKIRSFPWDVIVFQEQSRIPSLPAKRLAVMFPHLRKLADEARSQGAMPLLYQTWGYRDGDGLLPGDDFHKMTRRVRNGCREAAAHAGGLQVVPVGDAWEREVFSGRGSRLFMADGSHPTPRGDRRTAEVFYETIFGASNRQSPTPLMIGR